MIVFLIFTFLSILTIIVTTIYLNKKKKNDNKNVKENYKNDKKEKGNKRDKKQLSDILQIKIKDNMICVGNRYSSVIRLGNIDYNMLSNKEQDAIENVLIQTALAIDYPIQFFSTTENIDTSKVVALMKLNNIKNEKVQEYKNYLINYLENLMQNRTISVIKNYAIISYDGIYKNAVENLNRNIIAFKCNLLKANVVCDLLDENELYNLIYRELNKNTALSINSFNKGGKKLYVNKK